MALVVGLLLLGVVLGIILRYSNHTHWIGRCEKLLRPTLFCFLLAVGFTIGSDTEQFAMVGQVSVVAISIALSGIIGTLLVVKIFQKNFEQANCHAKASPVVPKITTSLRSCIELVSCFLVGLACGAADIVHIHLQWTQAPLFLLLFLAGVTVAAGGSFKTSLQQLKPVLLLLPVAILFGTLSGCWLVAFFSPTMSCCEAMSLGAGVGYYSMSCALVTPVAGPILGVTALLVNLFREVITLSFAPIIVKFFGPIGLMATGGTSAANIALGTVATVAGRDYVLLAIFSGALLMMVVPVLIPFLLFFL